MKTASCVYTINLQEKDNTTKLLACNKVGIIDKIKDKEEELEYLEMAITYTTEYHNCAVLK